MDIGIIDYIEAVVVGGETIGRRAVRIQSCCPLPELVFWLSNPTSPSYPLHRKMSAFADIKKSKQQQQQLMTEEEEKGGGGESKSGFKVAISHVERI